MTRDEIFGVTVANRQQVIENTRGQEVHETQSTRDFAADSLEIVEAVSRSMKQLKIRLPRTSLSGARNLRGLVDLFQTAQAISAVR
jgi:acyl carrier protein